MKKLAIVNIGGDDPLFDAPIFRLATYVGTYYTTDHSFFDRVPTLRIYSVYYLHKEQDFFYTGKFSKKYLDPYARELANKYQLEHLFDYADSYPEKLESVGIYNLSVINEFKEYNDKIKEIAKKETEEKRIASVDLLYLEERKREYEALKEATQSLKEAVNSITETKRLLKKKSI